MASVDAFDEEVFSLFSLTLRDQYKAFVQQELLLQDIDWYGVSTFSLVHVDTMLIQVVDYVQRLLVGNGLPKLANRTSLK